MSNSACVQTRQIRIWLKVTVIGASLNESVKVRNASDGANYTVKRYVMGVIYRAYERLQFYHCCLPVTTHHFLFISFTTIFWAEQGRMHTPQAYHKVKGNHHGNHLT